MAIFNSLKLLLNDFANIWKILLYKFIIFLISLGLIAGLVLPNVITIVNNIKDTGLFNNISELVNDFFARSQDITVDLEAFNSSLENSSAVLAQNSDKLMLSYIFIITFGSNIKYQSVKLFTVMPLYLIIIYAVWKIFSLLLPYIGLFSMFFAFLGLIVLVSLIQTLYCCQLPEIITNQTKTLHSVKKSFKNIKPHFTTTWSSYLLIDISIFLLNIVLAFFTCGAGLLLSIPMSSLFMIIYRLVTYYEIKGLKYYVDANTIIIPPNNTQIL